MARGQGSIKLTKTDGVGSRKDYYYLNVVGHLGHDLVVLLRSSDGYSREWNAVGDLWTDRYATLVNTSCLFMGVCLNARTHAHTQNTSAVRRGQDTIRRGSRPGYRRHDGGDGLLPVSVRGLFAVWRPVRGTNSQKYSLVLNHRNILGHRLLRICGQAAIPPPPPPPPPLHPVYSAPAPAAAAEAPQGWGWGTRWVNYRFTAPPGPPGPPGAPVSYINARARECEEEDTCI